MNKIKSLWQESTMMDDNEYKKKKKDYQVGVSCVMFFKCYKFDSQNLLIIVAIY